MGYVVTPPDGLSDGATEPAAAATTSAAPGDARHR
jgi:hypothetical protein